MNKDNKLIFEAYKNIKENTTFAQELEGSKHEENSPEHNNEETEKLYFTEKIAKKLPPNLTPSEVIGQCSDVGEEILRPLYKDKAKKTMYRMRWYDEDFVDDVLRAYAHFHGFRKEDKSDGVNNV